MTTPDLPPLPRVTRSMVFKHFGPNAGRDLLRTEWKDGIDLEVATYALQCFAEDYAAAAVLAEREDADRYRLLRRGQHWSVIDGVGDVLRAERLDAAIDAEMEKQP